MRAAWLVATTRIARQRGSLIALATVIGAVGAIVLGLTAGSRRTETAIDRFRVDSRAADVELILFAPPTREQISALRSMPGVVALAELHAYALLSPLAPELQTISTRTDLQYGTSIDRGRLVAGRHASQRATDELTVGEPLAARLHVDVGDSIDLVSFSRAQVAATLAGNPDVGPPAGTTFRLRVVGIERRPLDLGARGASGGLVDLPRAFDRLASSSDVGLFGERIRVRTTGGRAGDVIRRSQALFGPMLGSAEDLATETEGPRSDVVVSATALRILALAVALGAIVEMGLVLDGRSEPMADESPVLVGLGMTRGESLLADVAPSAVVGLGAATVAVVGAVAISARFPIGVARSAEPDPGFRIDAPVLLVGAGAMFVVVVALATLVGLRRSAQAHSIRRTTSRRRPTRITSGLVGLGAPTSAVIGALLATSGSGRRRGSLASWGRVATALGIAGVLGGVTYAANLTRVEHRPAATGAVFDRWLADTSSNARCGEGDPGLASIDGLSAATELCTQTVLLDGRPVTAVASRPLLGEPIGPAVIEGRSPAGLHEAALGTVTMERLGVRLGGQVTVTSHDGTDRSFRVVGRVAFPVTGGPQALADGIALPWDGYAPLFDINIFTRTFVVRFAPGTDRAAMVSRLDDLDQVGPPESVVLPVEVGRLVAVGWLPLALESAMALIALAAVLHLVGVDLAASRRDLRVLRALGITPHGSRWIIGWYAVVTTMGGLVVGIVAGAIVGRQAWAAVAGNLGIGTSAIAPWPQLLAVGAVALIVVISATTLLGSILWSSRRDRAIGDTPRDGTSSGAR